MSEKDVRALIRKARAALDARPRSTVERNVRHTVMPLVVGTGLFVAACSDPDVPPDQPAYMAVGASSPVGGAGGATGGTGGAQGGAGGATGGTGGAQGGAGGANGGAGGATGGAGG